MRTRNKTKNPSIAWILQIFLFTMEGTSIQWSALSWEVMKLQRLHTPLISITSPEAGAYTSLAALTDSTDPNDSLWTTVDDRRQPITKVIFHWDYILQTKRHTATHHLFRISSNKKNSYHLRVRIPPPLTWMCIHVDATSRPAYHNRMLHFQNFGESFNIKTAKKHRG